MENYTESAKTKKIKEYILKSGYPTEIEIGNILRENGWFVANQAPYIDQVTKNIRTIDVVGFNLVPAKMTAMLIIECKKSDDHEWTFFTQRKEDGIFSILTILLHFFQKLNMPVIKEKLKTITTINYSVFPKAQQELLNTVSELGGLHLFSSNIKIGLLQHSPNKKDDFHEATQQIIAEFRALARDDLRPVVYFPVIVFDGELFEFFYEKNELVVNSINHIQHISYSSGEIPVIIDVIRKTYFRDFLKMVASDMVIYNNLANDSRY